MKKVLFARRYLLFATLSMLAFAPVSKAVAHGGGILVQAVDNKITTNFDDEAGTTSFDVPAFSVLFNPTMEGGNNGPVDSPSFLSLASAPGTTDPLPQGVNVYWDFLPMTIDGTTSNLFYWDGVGSVPDDVDFGPVPQANVTMSLFDASFTRISVDGSNEMVPGALIGTTDPGSSGLRLHAHRFWFLDVEESESDPPDGIYLSAMQLRIEGMTNSDPFFIVAGTFGTSIAALDSAALPWATSHADSLIRKGDYNFDGMVDGFDFLAWQQQFGMQQLYPSGPFPVNGAYADGDGDNIVGAGDLALWGANVGPPPLPLSPAFAVVPESNSIALALMSVGSLLVMRTRRACALMT